MQAVCKQLEQIIMEEDDEDRGFITAKDFMNDFATEDFISKNIRVRPQSGLARADHETHKDDGFASRIGGDGAPDDDEKFNEMIKLDLENDRQAAKERRAEFMRRKAEEEEKLKKKRH